MIKKAKSSGRRLFVLDTNVLMHDPTALFRFQEHDIFLPMIVLEELDANKRGTSEVARNVRQVSRFLDDLMGRATKEEIDAGLQISDPLRGGNGRAAATGRLFFQTRTLSTELPEGLPGQKPDNEILSVAGALQEEEPGRSVIVVSKDIHMRIKAALLGIAAEDYYNDQVLDDASMLPVGYHALPADFWDTHGKDLESWQEEGHSYYRVSGPGLEDIAPGEFLFMDGDQGFEAVTRRREGEHLILEVANDYRSPKHAVWGITARNREQNLALNLLMDPDVDFVSLLGAAGTGKTLLALAAGLAQTLDQNRYREIIMTRVTVALGEDIGFLPGTEEEKMAPWMGALMDNLEVLTQGGEQGGDWARNATNDLLRHRIKIRAVNFMRGRTFLNRYIIIDEAQNLTSKQMRALVTRAGPGTKMVCIGNIGQIDTPYLSETTSGLTYVVDRFRQWEHSGHITLQRVERSRLADYAADNL